MRLFERFKHYKVSQLTAKVLAKFRFWRYNNFPFLLLKYNADLEEVNILLKNIATDSNNRSMDKQKIIAADIDNNRSTIKNVRLWDREPLLNTFSQLQEIRTYYDFGSIDTDRYRLNGDYRQVLLAPRELDSTSLPQRTFINERLTFTHGYGLTLSHVHDVTP